MKHLAPLSFALAALACGSNRPELPEGFDVTESCVRPGYPAGPFGSEPGDTAANACFRGWLEPHRVTHDEEALAPIALSDFHDPDGTLGIKLLLLNTAALWCTACRVEHETLPGHAQRLAPKGLTVVTAVFQGVEGKPATLADMTLWVETYRTNFPILLDPGYSFERYGPAALAPLNIVIDPRTMRVLEKYIGDQSEVLWPYIESELASRQ